MKIWLHRISHCSDVSEKLLENGYISIGFSDFANIQFLENAHFILHSFLFIS